MTKRQEIDLLKSQLAIMKPVDVVQALFELAVEGNPKPVYIACEQAKDGIKACLNHVENNFLKFEMATTWLDVDNQKHLDLINPQNKEM